MNKLSFDEWSAKIRRINEVELTEVLEQARSEQWRELALIPHDYSWWWHKIWLRGMPAIHVFRLNYPLRDIPKEVFRLPELVALDIGGNSVGEIGARALAKGLPRLRFLNIFKNDIGDSGVRALAEGMPLLTELIVTRNKIGDPGAHDICNRLKYLTTLNIGQNLLGPASGRSLASGLNGLTALDIGGNALGNVGVCALAKGLPRLTSLAIWSNAVGDEGAHSIGEGLPQLRELRIHTNSISYVGANALADSLPQLGSLNIRHNNLGDPGTFALASGLPELTTLDIGFNSVGDGGGRELAERLRQLNSLTIDGNMIANSGARALAECLPQLLTLDIYDNSIGNKGASALAEGLPLLTKLNVGSNSIGNAGACALAKGFPLLTTLKISDNSIGDLGVRALAKGLPRLNSLDISGNLLGEAAVESLVENSPHILRLNIGDNPIGDVGIYRLSEGLMHLTELYVDGSGIGDASAQFLAERFPRLRVLSVEDCAFSEAGARLLARGLSNLERLNIRGNAIADTGVVALTEGLHRLGDLDLSDNLLRNPPLSLLSRPNLYRINLSGNPGLGLPVELERETDPRVLLEWLRKADFPCLQFKAMLLGEGGTGKTWLWCRVLGLPRAMGDTHEATESFEFAELPLDVAPPGGEGDPAEATESTSVRCRLFDFGGQPYLFGTHRLFLASRRNVFVVVLNSRRSIAENRLVHWLGLVEHLRERGLRDEAHERHRAEPDRYSDWREAHAALRSNCGAIQVIVVMTQAKASGANACDRDAVVAAVTQWQTAGCASEERSRLKIAVLDPVDTKADSDGERAAMVVKAALVEAAREVTDLWTNKYPAALLDTMDRVRKDIEPALDGNLPLECPSLLSVNAFRSHYFTASGAATAPAENEARLWLAILRNLGIILWLGDRDEVRRDNPHNLRDTVFCPMAVRDPMYKIIWERCQQAEDGWVDRAWVDAVLQKYYTARLDPVEAEQSSAVTFELLKACGVLFESTADRDRGKVLIPDRMSHEPGPSFSKPDGRLVCRPGYVDDWMLPRFIGERIARRVEGTQRTRNGFVMAQHPGDPNSPRAAIRLEIHDDGPVLIVEIEGGTRKAQHEFAGAIKSDLGEAMG